MSETERYTVVDGMVLIPVEDARELAKYARRFRWRDLGALDAERVDAARIAAKLEGVV